MQQADQRRYLRSRIKCPVQLGVQDARGGEVTVECRGLDFQQRRSRSSVTGADRRGRAGFLSVQGTATDGTRNCPAL